MQKKDHARELNESLGYIRNSLSTSIGFEANAACLLIDELQFLLCPGCVTIKTPEGIYANILPDEQKAIMRCTRKFGWEQCLSQVKTLKVRHKNFPPIGKLYRGTVPLRLVLRDVTEAYEVAFRPNGSEWKMTIYYNPEHVAFRFWQFDDLFLKFILDVLKEIANASDSEQYEYDTKKLARLYHHFTTSQYLEDVLERVNRRIVKQLSKTHRYFGQLARQNAFFLQFFLIKGSEGFSNGKHELRFFPLRAQRRKLSEPKLVKEVSEVLQKKRLRIDEGLETFITKYLWDSERSFVGYSCDAKTSLYIPHWTEEPRPKGKHLNPREQKERRIATAIMQTLRDNTPHLFTIPLFAGERVIGVALINCVQDIFRSLRATTVRCTRDIGFMVSLSLEMDELVNRIADERRKLAQELTYRDIANAIFHEDGHFCRDLMTFLHKTRNAGVLESDADLLRVARRLSFYAHDKLGLYQDFRSSTNPIENVPLDLLYPSLRENPPAIKDIYVKEIQTFFRTILDIYCRDSDMDVHLTFGKCLTKRKKIPNFDSVIMGRILANLVRNSTDIANESEIKKPRLDIVLELVEKDDRKYLQIIAEDNCGGFKEQDQMPREVTVSSWAEYRNDKQEAGGMGFLMLARYTDATGGSLCRDTIKKGSAKGARVELNVGLYSRKWRERYGAN